MSFLRKSAIIIVLIFLINLFKVLQITPEEIFHADTLVSLGFILLAAFSFGELTAFLGLPRISGYLITGIIFGPYSDFIFQTSYLEIFSNTAVNDLRLLNGLAIGLIAITAGGEIKLKDLKEGLETISLIVLFKILLVSVPIAILIVAVSSYLPIFQNVSFQIILSISLLLGVLMIATSPAATIAVMNETNDRSKLSKYVLNTAVVKDIVIVILLGFLITFSKSNLSGESGVNLSIILYNFQELVFSLVAGAILGYLVIAYMKYVNSEMLIFTFTFILITTELNKLLHLDSLLVFITIGFVVQNFSNLGSRLIDPIEKLSMPVYVIFFTIAGAGMNIEVLPFTYQLAILIFFLRVIGIYFSTKFATRLAGEEVKLQNNLWFGFISQSAMVIGFTILIINYLPQLDEVFTPLVISIVGLNLLFGPALFRLGIKKFNRSKEVKEEKKVSYEEKLNKEVIPHKKFEIPQFENPELNELIISLREKLINHLNHFEQALIHRRSEEAIEFYYQVVEKYIDEYQQIKNVFTKGKVSGKELKEYVLKIQQELSKWFADISAKRKPVEQQILVAENLLQELFIDLKDYCEQLPEFIVIDQEEERYTSAAEDKLIVRIAKVLKRFQRRIRLLFGIKSKLKRKIPYITLVKYFFEYQIALEMEKVAFFLGLERLNVLRKTKKIYDDVTLNLEELLDLISEHKDIDAISILAIDKLNEIHDRLKQEISSIGEEIETSNQNIAVRLNYAFANPFNQFLKTISTAGTIELNLREFHFSKIYSDTIKAKETTLETIRFWVNYLIGFLGVCERDAKIIEATGKINSLINDTMINYSDNINGVLRSLISDLQKELNTCDKELSDKNLLIFENRFKLKSSIEKHRDQLLLMIYEKGINKLTGFRKSHSIGNVISVIRQRFKAIVNEYSDDIKVLDERDFELKETRTKYIQLKTLHFAKILETYFEKEVLQEIIKLNELIGSHISSSIIELKNIENLVRYHFNFVIDEMNKLETSVDLKDFDDNLKRIIDETLKVSIQLLNNKLKLWFRQIEKFEREIESSLTQKVQEQIENIQNAFRTELTLELEKSIKESSLDKLIKFIQVNISEAKKVVDHNFRKLKRVYRRTFLKFVKDVRELLEYEAASENVIVHSYDQSVFDEKAYKSLPFIYRKLFDYLSSEIMEVLVGREKEKEILKLAYERNQKGLTGSVAIIGESGTGKSSLINAFLNETDFESEPIRYEFEETVTNESELLKIFSQIFNIGNVHSIDELIVEINISSKNQVVILEDIHKLYLRKLDGLNAIKKLLLLISVTGNKIFWIVSISYHAWQYLNHLLKINLYFPFQIVTENLIKEQIKEAILKRHNTSGFNLQFLPPENLRVYEQLKYSILTKERKSNLEEMFFDNLYEACDGNITSALFYWIKSIKEFKNETIYLNPIRKLDFRFLHKLDIKTLLTISNLIQHGSLTIQEHQMIFKINEEESKTIMNFLNDANIVWYDVNRKGEKVFFINPALYKPIEVELKKLHIFD